MFLLFLYVCFYNICVEKTEGNCKNKCQGLPEDAIILDHLPTNDDVSSLSDGYNVYVSESIEWSSDAPTQKYNEFITCEDSVEFLVAESINQISISSYIGVFNGYQYRYIYDLPAPIKFNIDQNITIFIDSCEKYPQQSIILKATKPNLFIKAEFRTKNFDSNKIIISEDSNSFNIFDIDDNIKSIFTRTNKLIEIAKSYFCISDKTEKCVDYSQYNPIIINSPSEVTGDSVVLIIESKINQIYANDYLKRYIKFIGLEGSHLTYMSTVKYTYSDGNFHVIINDNDITMSNSKFEGQGSFTLGISMEISLYSTTNTSSIKFTLKTEPNTFHSSNINGIRNNEINLVNKIHVPEFSIFWGKDYFKNYFEEDKYIIQNERYDIESIDDLTSSIVEGLNYYFSDGDYEIPMG